MFADRRLPLLLAVATTLSVSGAVAAQASFPPPAAVQRLVDARVAGRPGLGLVLLTRDANGRTRLFRAGTTGRDGLALDGDTLFEIGSITKTFTAALLADTVVRGEVRLDDPVAAHLPDGWSVPRRAGREITLLDLATHTSALPGLPANLHPKDVANPYAEYTAADLARFLAAYELPRDVGSAYEYSAVGFGLLGQALGHRLGTTWEDALVARVLHPLRMESTRATLGPAAKARLAAGHDGAGRPVSGWDIPGLAAMGALHSSANDMARFLAANVDAPAGPLGRALAMAHAPRVAMDEETRVGLAWQTGHATNRTIVWHGGGTGGYRALVAFEPRTRLAVVVLANWAGGADDVGFHLLDATLPVEGPAGR